MASADMPGSPEAILLVLKQYTDPDVAFIKVYYYFGKVQKSGPPRFIARLFAFLWKRGFFPIGFVVYLLPVYVFARTMCDNKTKSIIMHVSAKPRISPFSFM